MVELTSSRTVAGRVSRQWMVIVGCSLLVAAVYSYPDVRFIMSLGDQYQGIAMTATQDELFYLGRIKALYKGHPWTISNIYNWERAEDPWVRGALGENVVAMVGKTLGLSVVQLDILMSAVLPVILFWLCWRLTVDLGGSPRMGLLSAGAILFGYYWFTPNLGMVVDLLTGKNGAPPLWFLRPLSPQFNHVMLLAVLVVSWRALTRPNWGWVVIAGVLFGGLFYTFVFYWTFVAAGVGLYTVVACWRRERSVLVRCASLLLIGGLLSIPYWLNMLAVFAHPGFNFLEMRQGVVHTRTPFIPWVHVVLIGAIAAAGILCRKGREVRFTLAFLAGGLLCLNQQLVTGHLVQPSHYQNYSNKTMLLIALAAAAGWILTSGRLPRLAALSRHYTLAVAGGLALLVFAAILQQTHYYNQWKDHYAKWQVMAPPLKWLSSHTPKNSVVLTDPFGWFGEGRPFRMKVLTSSRNQSYLPSKADTFLTEWEVLVYSHNEPYLPPMSGVLMTEEEVRHRYLVALHFFGYTEAEARRFIRFGDAILFQGLGAGVQANEPDLKEKVVATIEAAYREIRKVDPVEALKPYRADYVLVDRASQAASRLTRLSGRLKLSYADRRFVIYRIRPKM